MKHVAHFLATGAYAGLSPLAPGTAGSLVAAFALSLFDTFHDAWFWGLTLLLLVCGTWAAAQVEAMYAKKDAQLIVIDEILGMFVSVAMLPATWTTLIFALVFFRIFDILKPPPVRQAEKIEALFASRRRSAPAPYSLASGLGVMLDDVIAGIYANICVRILIFLSVI